MLACHVDMNSFFASCEQHMRPELRGRPIGVAAVRVANTACIAVSYEAKARGVKTGMHVREALERCPGFEVILARPPEYVRIHRRIRAAVESVLPVEQVQSIDEMYGLLCRRQRTPEAARQVGLDIKRAIYRAVGPTMHCSVGIAPNPFLAKVATNLQKPNGLVILSRDDVPQRLFDLELIDLPGIGERMLARLHRRGVRSVRELCGLDESEMYAIWGSVVGRRWWHWLRGLEWALPKSRTGSVGHSHVLAPQWRDPERAFCVAVKLLSKAAERMRRMGYHARRLHLSLKFEREAGQWSADASVGMTRSTLLLGRALTDLWPHRPVGPDHERILKIAVTLHGLLPDAAATLPLFDAERGRSGLDEVLDRINEKYGPNTICLGPVSGAKDTAPVRIAFSRVPDGVEVKGDQMLKPASSPGSRAGS